MLSKRLRIGIDARYLSHGLVGGVHTYIRNLTRALIESDAPIDYDLWIDDKCPFDAGELPAGSQTRVLPWRSPLSSMRHDLRLGMLMRRAGANVVHFPANYGFAPPGVPTIVTLHDAINIMPYREIIGGHEKRLRTMLMMSYLHLATRRAVRQQPFVITVSQHARREILRHADLDPDRVRVVYSAADARFKPLRAKELAATQQEFGAYDHVLLADAIKNPRTTLNAYRRLPEELRDRTRLVFFSRREPDAEVSHAALAGECQVILRPSTDELARLHNVADLFIFPSWIEGFGLPALEAMSCGSPVVASGAGSIPEIVDDGGVIVPDPDDADGFSVAIARLLTDANLRGRLTEQALQRATAFSWQRTAAETQAAYVSAIEESRASTRRLGASSAVRA